MRVVDTSAWIEWLISSKTGVRLTGFLPGYEQWLVPTIVQMELAKWARRERGEVAFDALLALSGERLVANLTTPISIRAAEVSREHRLSTADAIIYATALEHGADLLTCDAHFEGLERVILVGMG
jgi:uncharacterized protein